MALPQRAIGGILHDQKGHPLLHIKIEDGDDGGVSESSNGLGFALEVLRFCVGQMQMQHLDGRLLTEAQVLAQVDLCKAALSQEGQQAIVAQLLSHAVSHRFILSGKRAALDSLSSGEECLRDHRPTIAMMVIVPQLLNDDIHWPSHGTIVSLSTAHDSACRRAAMPTPCDRTRDAN